MHPVKELAARIRDTVSSFFSGFNCTVLLTLLNDLAQKTPGLFRSGPCVIGSLLDIRRSGRDQLSKASHVSMECARKYGLMPCRKTQDLTICLRSSLYIHAILLWTWVVSRTSFTVMLLWAILHCFDEIFFYRSITWFEDSSQPSSSKAYLLRFILAPIILRILRIASCLMPKITVFFWTIDGGICLMGILQKLTKCWRLRSSIWLW